MTLRFHDVSHYQGNYHPNGPTIAKATEGTGFTDSQYSTNRSRTLAGGWPFAGYHFLTTEDASAQARHAHAVIGSTPAMLDVESGTSGNPSLSRVQAFIDAYRKLGGVLHLIYLPKWYWSDAWGSPSLKPLNERGMRLISSQYTTYSDNGPGWDAYGGMKPVIWQYTATPIDTNAFKGTQAELGNLFATGSTEGADDMAVMVTIPAGYGDDSGKQIPIEDAVSSLMRYMIETRNNTRDLETKVAAIPTTPVPAGPLSDADVSRIAAAVADLLRQPTVQQRPAVD
jgi:hypothetical protein